ncbi:DNA polymerase III subunit gamma/tau, partial [Candidatus Gracilibacteria bacterium]
MSLYLKYRPQDFDNLVGQKFIKDTLQKSLDEDKYVGAYLLCGPRGTGKTSTARLLAKTMNCLNKKNGNPCLKCDICKNFAEERLVDIIEIDAASNTGVDNIRELIEKAQFRPTLTKFKVYIIDEVHMLSKGAFNALLKILEEPPSFVKFILATTETHKVPETIISRCQRYDFRRISNEDIKNRLLLISKKENITIDDKSIDYIIQNSGGGLRNAISLLEQLNNGGKIIFDEVIDKLGISPNSQYKEFFKQLLENDSNVIKTLENINSSGKNIKLFFKGLIFYIKDDILKDLKKGKSIVTKLKVLQILDETYTKTKNSLNEDITFLVGVLNIINREEISKENLNKKITKEKTIDTDKKSNNKEIKINNSEV